MAIGATNVALRNLEEYSSPWFMRSKDDDVVTLRRWVPVIEVEHDDVGFATVNARMSAEVVPEERTVLFAIAANSCDLLAYVGFAVSDVVLAPVLRVTPATSPLPGASGFVRERERLDRLEPPAVVAPLCCWIRRQRQSEGGSHVYL